MLFPIWATVIENEKSYKDYLRDLCKHSFAFCPQGNGIDCYRILECLYCGCIPIVTDEVAYGYLNDLPHVKLSAWSDVTLDFLKENLKNLSKVDFNMDKIKIDYWKNKIEHLRSLL